MSTKIDHEDLFKVGKEILLLLYAKGIPEIEKNTIGLVNSLLSGIKFAKPVNNFIIKENEIINCSTVSEGTK